MSLPHPLRGIVVFPEHAKQIFVASLRGVVNDEHDFVVPREAGAHFAIRRVRRVAGRVADGRRVDARELPELLLRPPETAHAEQRRPQTVRERRLEAMPVHEVRVGHTHPFGTAGQRFDWRRNAQGFHGVFLSGSKARAAPFMQYRMPVGGGPSGNKWPR